MIRRRTWWLLAGAAVLSLLWIFFVPYSCPIHEFFGIGCPGCGLTRAWRAVFAGDFLGAFALHPLFWLPVVMAVYLVLVLSKKLPYHPVQQITVFSGALSAFLLVYILRIVAGDPVLL